MRLFIPGRPAPQGSKDANMRESSVYLRAWRAAIKEHVFRWYKDNGVKPGDLPYIRGEARLQQVVFCLDTGQRIDSPPDLDKLLRALFDALTQARVWEDDGRCTSVGWLEKKQIDERGTGVDIWVIGVGE